MSCLAKDPDLRPQSMEQILDVLTSLGEGQPASLSAPVAPGPVHPQPEPRIPGRFIGAPPLAAAPGEPRRGLRRFFGLGVGAGVILLLLAWAAMHGLRSRPALDPAPDVISTAVTPPPSPVVLPETAPAASTIVVTTSSPAAKIWLDGKELGQGQRVQLKGILPGQHQLRVEAPGMTPFSRAVETFKGKTAELHVALTPDKVGGKPRGKVRAKPQHVRAGSPRGHAPPTSKHRGGCVPQTKQPPYVWCDGPCKRVIKDRDLFSRRFAHRSYRSPGLSGINTRKLYTPGAIHAALAPHKKGFQRCYKQWVRCSPEFWFPTFSVGVDNLGNTREVKRRPYRLTFPPRFVGCMTEVLQGINWGNTREGKAGKIDLTFSMMN